MPLVSQKPNDKCVLFWAWFIEKWKFFEFFHSRVLRYIFRSVYVSLRKCLPLSNNKNNHLSLDWAAAANTLCCHQLVYGFMCVAALLIINFICLCAVHKQNTKYRMSSVWSNRNKNVYILSQFTAWIHTTRNVEEEQCVAYAHQRFADTQNVLQRFCGNTRYSLEHTKQKFFFISFHSNYA